MYSYFNPNPKKKKNADDCVIRAICAAENRTWDEVFKELCEIAFELKEIPNSIDVVNKYLADHGWQKHPIKVAKGSRRPTVEEMADLSRSEGVIICSIAHHFVTVKMGDIWDIWDCSKKSLYTYWTEF